jgi:hypothetical protein
MAPLSDCAKAAIGMSKNRKRKNVIVEVLLMAKSLLG